MGCWHETCGISNLPIKGGDEVVIFVLTNNYSSIEMIDESVSLYSVLPIPFYGIYNEYGGADNCYGNELNLVMDSLKKSLVEIDEGTNKYHEIDVKRDNFSVDKFFEACAEHRMKVETNCVEFSVDRVMIRKDVFDHILDNYQFKEWISERHDYMNYKFSDIISDLPEFVRRAKVKIMSEMDDLGCISSSYRYITPFRGLFTKNAILEPEMNLADIWMKRMDSYEFTSPIFNPTESSIDLLQNKSEDEVITFLTEYVKCLVIDSFLRETRKMWIPQAGKGSQNDEHAPYRVLISAMNKVLDTEQAKWDYNDKIQTKISL